MLRSGSEQSGTPNSTMLRSGSENPRAGARGFSLLFNQFDNFFGGFSGILNCLEDLRLVFF